MADRSVTPEETFADFRETYIATCTDIGDITTLGNTFTGTATDLVEACNKSPSQGLTIGLCCALG
tara:strand:+ start:470 stop:664 length:195 start_codon:yes stop_codon:yes gene_type:complete